ncbi:MAG: 2-C-methyl-D-erythritol 2,4-cyclodiphosphate synthase [Verrucomicrobia bacterium]|nr:2-C-methyl-D-erythritol 2,4-cyclodiphosphate synthase [Verrucomicrobiota bacterium]
MTDLPYRIGFGYDIHRLVTGRKLILGGVEILGEMGLEGHSDADCLTHALADAILGACGLPDIGHQFPNTDPSIEGINSQLILRKAADLAAEAGYQIGNIDACVIAEKPRISPYIDAMKSTLSSTLQITPGRIGIKATTQEKIGALGASQGIAAHAVCLLLASKKQP